MNSKAYSARNVNHILLNAFLHDRDGDDRNCLPPSDHDDVSRHGALSAQQSISSCLRVSEHIAALLKAEKGTRLKRGHSYLLIRNVPFFVLSPFPCCGRVRTCDIVMTPLHDSALE